MCWSMKDVENDKSVAVLTQKSPAGWLMTISVVDIGYNLCLPAYRRHARRPIVYIDLSHR